MTQFHSILSQSTYLTIPQADKAPLQLLLVRCRVGIACYTGTYLIAVCNCNFLCMHQKRAILWVIVTAITSLRYAINFVPHYDVISIEKLKTVIILEDLLIKISVSFWFEWTVEPGFTPHMLQFNWRLQTNERMTSRSIWFSIYVVSCFRMCLPSQSKKHCGGSRFSCIAHEKVEKYIRLCSTSPMLVFNIGYWLTTVFGDYRLMFVSLVCFFPSSFFTEIVNVVAVSWCIFAFPWIDWEDKMNNPVQSCLHLQVQIYSGLPHLVVMVV